MSWLGYLADSKAIFVADTSVLINLNATGRAESILGGLPCRFVVPENVCVEIENGRVNGHADADHLDRLVALGHLKRVALGEAGLAVYERLVDGSTLRTLDDGEAATIGCAVELSGIALIDERKAQNLCAEHFPTLPLICTVELLLSAHVADILGPQEQVGVLLNALRLARMRVPKPLVPEVRRLIGHDHAENCTSLPRTALFAHGRLQ